MNFKPPMTSKAPMTRMPRPNDAIKTGNRNLQLTKLADAMKPKIGNPGAKKYLRPPGSAGSATNPGLGRPIIR